MRNKWILGIGVLAIVLGGLFLMGYISLPGPGNTSDMEIIFYDADGNELGRTDTRLALFGVQSPDFVGNIHSLEVVVYFEVTTDIDYAWITTGCWLTVVTRLNTPTAGIVHTIDEHRLGAVNTDESGTFYATYLMETLLPDNKIEAIGKANGWSMSFNARLETEVGSGIETIKSVEDTCATSLSLVWKEDGLTLVSWFGDW